MPNKKELDDLLTRLLTESTGKVVQIRPIATELSLAFEPKTGKPFFMRKDGNMPNFIEILKDQKPLPSQDKILKMFKDAKMSEDGQEAVAAAIRLLDANKDALPEGFMTQLSKDVDGFDKLVTVEKPVDEKAIRADERKKALEEMAKDDKSGFAAMKGQLEKMEKDLTDSGKKRAELEVQLMSVVDEKETMRIRKDLSDKHVPGDLDEVARMAHSLGKINKDLQKSYLNQQEQMAGMISTLGLEDQLGFGGDTLPSDSVVKLNKLTTERMEKDSIPFNEAYAKIVKENPDLFRDYIKNRSK